MTQEVMKIKGPGSLKSSDIKIKEGSITVTLVKGALSLKVDANTFDSLAEGESVSFGASQKILLNVPDGSEATAEFLVPLKTEE